MSANFDKHYATYLTADKTEKYSKGITKLNIIDEATSSRTRSLDGSERATNSDKWSLVTSFEFQRTYIGSDGDLLNIYYRPDDDPKGTHCLTAVGYDFGVCIYVYRCVLCIALIDFWINVIRQVSLHVSIRSTAIANVTKYSEILFRICSSTRNWNDVVHL